MSYDKPILSSGNDENARMGTVAMVANVGGIVNAIYIANVYGFVHVNVTAVDNVSIK
ncbi:MAG: hypothetical protein HFI75_05800 [Lachnospiraceae bacterium]|nr:hypothetical protein [Lachnospiraceae bacterium]